MQNTFSRYSAIAAKEVDFWRFRAMKFMTSVSAKPAPISTSLSDTYNIKGTGWTWLKSFKSLELNKAALHYFHLLSVGTLEDCEENKALIQYLNRV